MNSNLKLVLLNSRQFIGFLLVLFSLSALAVAVLADSDPETDALANALARHQAESQQVESHGFLFPPLSGLLPALTGATAFLALLAVWLDRGKMPQLRNAALPTKSSGHELPT